MSELFPLYECLRASADLNFFLKGEFVKEKLEKLGLNLIHILNLVHMFIYLHVYYLKR